MTPHAVRGHMVRHQNSESGSWPDQKPSTSASTDTISQRATGSYDTILQSSSMLQSTSAAGPWQDTVLDTSASSPADSVAAATYATVSEPSISASTLTYYAGNEFTESQSSEQGPMSGTLLRVHRPNASSLLRATILKTTPAPPPPEEFCSNSHIVSADTIIAFTEDTDAILFVCTLLSSVLQVYVMAVALRHIRQKTGDKCMHVFLLSMTFADFILTALCYPVELAPRAGLIEYFPKYVSATMHMLCWIALIVSSFSLVFLNLDKLFYFRFPLRYNNYFTQRRAILLVTGFWLVSALFVVFAWWSNSFHCVDEDCVTLAIFPNRLHIYIPFMIFVGVTPTLTSLLVAIYIMKIVAAHRQQMCQERSLCPPTAPGRSNSVFASRMRTFYFIFMTTVFTAMTLLPYRVAGLQRSLNPGRMHDCMTIMLFWVMMYMIYLHSIINPLITITVLPPYRLSVLEALRCGAAMKPAFGGAPPATAAYLDDAYGVAPRLRSRLPSEL